MDTGSGSRYCIGEGDGTEGTEVKGDFIKVKVSWDNNGQQHAYPTVI